MKILKRFFLLFSAFLSLAVFSSAQKTRPSVLKCVESGIYDASEIEGYAEKSGDKKLYGFAVIIKSVKGQDLAADTSALLNALAYVRKFKNPVDRNVLLSAVYVLWGNVLKFQDDFAGAREKFRTGLGAVMDAVKISPECAVFLAGAEGTVAQFEILTKNFPMAQRLCMEAEEIYSKPEFSHLNICLEGRASVLNSYGIVCAEIPIYSEAKKKYCASLEAYKLLKEKTGKSYGWETALVFNNLGVLYDNAGSFDDALYNYKKAEEILKSISKKNSVLELQYAKLLADEGNLFRKFSFPDSALVYLEAALEIFGAETSLSESGKFQLSVLYNSLAALGRAEKNYGKADEFFTACCKLRKELAALSDAYLPFWAETLSEYGGFCVENVDIDLAVYYSSLAVEVRKKVSELSPTDENMRLLAEEYDNSAYIRILSGDSEGAVADCENSRRIRREILSSDHESGIDGYYNTLCNLSTLYNKEGKFVRALEVLSELEENLKRYSDTLGEDYNYKSALTAFNTALAFDALGRKAEAYSSVRNAYLKIAGVSGGEGEKYLVEEGDILIQLGNYAFDAGEFPAAEDYYKKAVVIRTELSGKGIISFAAVSGALNNLGLLYHGTNEPEKARECFLKAQKLFDAISEEDYDIEAATAFARTAVNSVECAGGGLKNVRLLNKAEEVLRPFAQTPPADYYYGCIQKMLDSLKK